MPMEQILRIEPEQELKFKGPFNVPTTSVLKLKNPSDRRVCFKIKTTAPKRYCVRPNAGILEPGNHLSIAVVFQPCELEPTANKHKFMVQALYVPDGEVNMDALWKDVDQTNLMDTKLRCTFEMPADATSQNDLNAVQEEKVARSKLEDVSAKPSKQSDENARSGDAGRPQESQLKAENARLKEEVERLRRQLKSRMESGEPMLGMATAASPPAQTMLFIVLAIIIALASLVIGKFIL